MKTKIGTIIDEELLRRARMVAAANRMPLSKVLENALREYLDRRRGPQVESIVASTWGAMPVGAPLVQAIMKEESILEI